MDAGTLLLVRAVVGVALITFAIIASLDGEECRVLKVACPLRGKAGQIDESAKNWWDAQAAEAAWFEREGALRREVAAQEERLRFLEVQKAELAAASADGTRPLLRYGHARALRGQPPTVL